MLCVVYVFKIIYASIFSLCGRVVEHVRVSTVANKCSTLERSHFMEEQRIGLPT